MSIQQLAHRPGITPAGQVPGIMAGPRLRLVNIDLVRGIVMVLMALDHTRGFFSNLHFDLTDPAQTTTAVFFTRWVTHFCAPVFVFLTGVGAFLYGTHGRTRGQLAWFLVSRGAWLVFLEFTLIHFAWSFRVDDPQLFAQVIWAIGCSLILLAGLAFLPAPLIGVIGLLVVAGHQTLAELLADRGLSASWLLGLPCPDRIEFGPGVSVFVLYPVLPWFGVLALGYGLGPLWTLEHRRHRRLLAIVGIAAISAFVLLRWLNGYEGDPNPWSPQPRGGWYTLLSFLNCSKYPPSLLFVLMTLGPAILALAWLDRPPRLFGRVFVTFGRVPLFYYLLHLFVIHGLAVGLALAYYGHAEFLFRSPVSAAPPTNAPPNAGVDLPVVYLLWLLVVAILYGPCLWYAGVKSRHREGWLSYL
jgi:uncharacterized membrane protein